MCPCTIPGQVDLSSVVPSSLHSSTFGPARKLELEEEPKLELQEVKKEAQEEEDEEVSLMCNEKIVDSPSPGKKQESKVKQEPGAAAQGVKQEVN